MTKGTAAKTFASALGVALVGLLFLSPAAGFITSLSGTAERDAFVPIYGSRVGLTLRRAHGRLEKNGVL
jgi:hypothetical protein